jgi:hypothetical protein
MKSDNATRCASLTLLCAILLNGPAWAEGIKAYYSCRDASGHLITSDRPIPECQGRQQDEHNLDGSVRRVIEAPLTPEERKARDAEIKRKQDEEIRVNDQRRFDRALLSSYSSVESIDAAHARARAEPESGIQKANERLATLIDEEKKNNAETEFYAKHKLPSDLERKIQDNKAAQNYQLSLIARRKSELDRLKARFENERIRFLELTESAPPGKH